jgi:HSP20 family protein
MGSGMKQSNTVDERRTVMFMTRWEPHANLWSEMDRFRNQMNELFGRYGTGAPSWPGLAYSYPPLNLWEDGDHVYVEAELPGMQLDGLEIYVSQGDQLTIQGERKPLEAEKGVWHRQERGFGKFSRVITLPVPVDADKVEARFENGVLLVTLPKSEMARPRRITVKAE